MISDVYLWAFDILSPKSKDDEMGRLFFEQKKKEREIEEGKEALAKKGGK